jgi:cell wall assembly regulator SMI1
MSILRYLEHSDLYKRYHGWDHGNTDAYRSMGRNADREAIEKVEDSLMFNVPYNIVAMGAAQIGDVDMLSYLLDKDPSMDLGEVKRIAIRYKQQVILQYLDR